MPVNYQMTWDPALAPRPLGVAGNWTLDFRDEFNGSVVDAGKWQVMGASPWQLDHPEAETLDGDPMINWRPANATIESGALKLVLEPGAPGGELYSGALISLRKFYRGFFEARVKFVGGFPAWWLSASGLGDTDYTGPVVDGLEIDIAESRAFAGTPQSLQHAVHWGGYGAHHQSQEYPLGDGGGDWHIVGCEWLESSLRFYLDGVLTNTFTTVTTDNPDHQMLLTMGRYDTQTTGEAYWDYVRHWTGG